MYKKAEVGRDGAVGKGRRKRRNRRGEERRKEGRERQNEKIHYLSPRKIHRKVELSAPECEPGPDGGKRIEGETPFPSVMQQTNKQFKL